MKKTLKIIGLFTLMIVLVTTLTLRFAEWWPAFKPLSTDPQIYTMQFGVTVNKFIVLGDPPRLHLVVPLPVTGESGRVIEIDKIAKKGRRGK